MDAGMKPTCMDVSTAPSDRHFGAEIRSTKSIIIPEVIMNEDVLNMQVRKFLKQVGVTSQREIEHAIIKAVESGRLQGNETLEVQMTLELPDLVVRHRVQGEISLEE